MSVLSKFDQNILNWVLFLDRDGVINEKIDNDYVRTWEDFKFVDGSLEAICAFGRIFSKIFIVTNQRGVGKGLMSISQLNDLHNKMLLCINESSGRIDGVYSCTEINDNAICRKPNIGMALLAKKEFPEVNFSTAIMVGDSMTDMEFGKKLGMKTVFIGKKDSDRDKLIDIVEDTLFQFYLGIKLGRYTNIFK
jgi:D-glycero-D-manno-heptose 1,7-bisphosphate phosphatase